MTKVSRALNFFFKQNLLLTNSITSGAFMAIGDYVEQEIELRALIKVNPEETIDWARIGRMFVVGTALGPLHHYYYIYLDKLLPKVTIINVSKKLLYDQLIASPATLVCFFFGMGMLEGQGVKKTTIEIQNKFLYSYLGDWIFWPPVQFVNFYYLPTKYRVFYINGATMLFNVFLSYMKHDFET